MIHDHDADAADREWLALDAWAAENDLDPEAPATLARWEIVCAEAAADAAAALEP